MNMMRMSRKHILLVLVLITLIDNTHSHENDTSTDGQRHARVSGRIVKLYSGPKPDPVLCVSEGFLADAVDCSVFYRCLKTTHGKYTVYRFQCGPGTVYDPDTEVCNHPRSTKRLECGGLTYEKVTFPTERYMENEIDGLHKENQELPSPNSTKPPKLSNSLTSTIATSIPKKPENSYPNSHSWFSTTKQVNDVMTTPTNTSPWSIPTAVSTRKPWYHTSVQDTYYVTRQPNTQNGVQCTSDGFIGDNEDCRKFYRCVNNQRGGYIKYEFSCSESTIWDDDTQGCNHPWAVQRRRCGKGNNYDDNSNNYIEQIKNNEVISNNNIQQSAQNSYGSQVTEIQTSIKPVLPDQTGFHFGDRLNAENISSRKNQTQNYHAALINQNHVQVDYENKITQSQLSINYSNQSSKTTYILPSTIPTTSLPYEKGSKINRCTKEGFMGDSNDCKKFYRCIGNRRGEFIMFELSCNEGTVWDDQLETCNHGWAVKECGKKKFSQNMSHVAAVIENTTLKNYVTPSLSDSNEIDDIGYGNQNNHQEIQQSTTLMTTQTTKAATANFDSSKPYEEQGCESNGFFGDTNDCAKFHRCVGNGGGKFTKYEYKCGEGTAWDPEIQACNHVWLVKSCGNSITNGAQQETVTEQSNSKNTIITTVLLIQTTTQKNIFENEYDGGYQTLHSETSLQSTTSTERTLNQENECRTPGYMSDKDCKKFYRCTDNGHGGYTRYEFTCGEGTVWDPSIEACNHAWAVKTCGVNSTNDNVVTLAPAESQDNSDKDDNYNEDSDKNSVNTIITTTLRSTTNYVPPEANKANDCKSSGFMGHNNDCKIFYRCVDNGNGGFIRYEFLCGEGTVWDPKIDACNHEWAVSTCGANNSTSESINISTDHSNITTVGISTEISTQSTLSSSSSIITSTLSDTNNQCMTDGFIADKQDCKKFYRCVDNGKGTYTRYEFACGEGTVWDPKIGACNHIQEVKSCGSNIVPDSESVTSPSSNLNDEETNNNHVSQDSQVTTRSTENSSWSSSTMISSTTMSVSMECNKDGFIGDSNDCKKFYRCVNDGKGNFIRYEFLCGEGTVWDTEINACNHVNSVKTPCNPLTVETPEYIESNYTTDSSSSEANDYSTSSKKPPKLQECEQEGFFGEKNDCKKFYRCTDDGQGGFNKYEFTCGEGTIWDQEKLTCNHASSSLHCGSTDEESQAENSEVHPTETPTGSLQTTEVIKPSLNIDDCAYEGFYANSNDCKKFFRCVGDGKGGFTRYDFTCGEGTIWVQDIQACDHDTDTSLCGKGTITTTTTSGPSHSSQEKPVTTASTTTTRSTTVDKSSLAPAKKPIMQDEAVSGSSTTSDKTTTSTETSATSQDDCVEAGYFGNSNDCKMFYRCVDNGKGGFTKYDFTCGDGTIWDQDITTCNHPQDVTNPSCSNEENGETMTTTTTTKSTTTAKTKTTTASNESSKPTEGTSSIGSTTTESSNQSPQDVSTKKPGDSNYTCNKAGYYADPYDCKKFYRCVDWGGDGKTFSIYHFDCGEGTIWDPNLQTCNHEESAFPPRECSGTQSQAENNNDTTTTAKQETTTESNTSTEMSTTHSSTATTESSSNTEQTQQSTPNEQTSSTPQSTTQTSTTEQSTTLSSTTEQSTTQKSTTEQSTTQKSTTEQSTTQKSTTEQSTTQKSTTEESTTEPNTTQQPTTEQSTTQQSNTEPSTTQQSTTASDKTTIQQSSTTQQSTTSEQTTTTTTEQTTTSSNEETTTTTAQPTTSESTTSATDQTTKAEQTTTQETTEQSSENQSTTEQSTTQSTVEGSSTTESGQDTTTEQESSNKDCPETDDDQYTFVCPTGFRRHPKYCNLFYQCTEDDDNHEMKVAIFNCPNNTIYDESKTQCVEENKAEKKCDGQIAQRRRVKRLDANYKEPITVRKEKYLCPAAGHFPFEKNEQCSPLLFKCEISKSGKLRGFMYQCPQGYIYWSISRRCEPVSTMTECTRSLSNWNERYEIPIERKNVARRAVK